MLRHCVMLMRAHDFVTSACTCQFVMRDMHEELGQEEEASESSLGHLGAHNRENSANFGHLRDVSRNFVDLRSSSRRFVQFYIQKSSNSLSRW